MAAIAEIGGAEHQPLAHLRNVGAVAQMLEVPRAVDGIAIEHGADDLLVAQNDPLVDAAGGVLHDDLFLVRARREIAGGEQVDAGHLQFGRNHRAVIGGKTLHGEVVGANLGLVEQRSDEAVGLAAMLHAFADGIDAPVIGLHGVGDDDAALAMKACLARQLDIRTNADRHHDEIRRDLLAVGKAHAGHAILAKDRFRLRGHLEHHAALFQRLAQQSAGDLIELALHQRVEQVHDGDVHAALHQAVGGFEAEQTAADHDGVLVAGRGLDHALDVLNVAKADDAREVLARQRQHDRVRTGGDQQAIVRHPRAFSGDDFAGTPIDHLDHFALAQRDAVVLVPLLGVEHDVVDGLLAGEHGRQQNPVVVAVGLGTEDGDVIEIGRPVQQHFDRADAGHAVADHHQLLLVYFLEHALPSRFRWSHSATQLCVVDCKKY